MTETAEVVCVVRRWGPRSLGFVIPRKTVLELELKPIDVLRVHIEKRRG
jgi:antitoxin component of MazEF toxin-antitoxin module